MAILGGPEKGRVCVQFWSKFTSPRSSEKLGTYITEIIILQLSAKTL